MAMAIRPMSALCYERCFQQQRAGIPHLNGRPSVFEKPNMRTATRSRASAQSTAVAAQDTVRVRFSTHFQAAYGESLKVVGSSSAVGAWDVAAAPGMCWTDGNVWALDLDLPEHADFEYKIAHVHYNGTSWEQCENRLFQAGAALPDHAALDISCAYNHPELTVVKLAPLETLASLDNEDTWDPAAQGLPADLTEELSQKGIVDSLVLERELEPAVSRSWAEVQQEAPVFQTEAAVAVEQAVQIAALQEEAAPEKQTAQGPAAAAGAVALALGVGVVMSALAIDLTDAAVASAVFAAGATFLPAKDAQDARKTVSKVMAGGLNATEAIARGFGLKSHVEQRTEREAALKAQEQPGTQEQVVAAPADDNITLVSPSAGVLPGMTDIIASSSEKALAESVARAQDKKEVAH